MLVSFSWLRELCDLEGVDAARAASALTSRGLTVDGLSRSGEDSVLDIDVPANRPDCLGHLGIARELAAAFGRRLVPRPPASREAGDPAEQSVRVRIEAPDLCPRYTARVVRGVRIGASPDRVVSRLEACGLRSVNNVVDASNLVLLELGHPIHAFDLATLSGATIRVRRAAAAEALTTLDGVDRTLDPGDLVIADADRAVALAGIIGGAATEIRDATRDVLVEAAVFSPGAIRRTARRLGLATDASHRFERGVDAEAVIAAQDLAARLLAELASGVAAPGVVDAWPVPPSPAEIVLRPERVELLLGFDPGRATILGSLGALGLAPREERDGTIRVVPPSFRFDLLREVDLVEEVARHVGYDLVPAVPLAGPVRPADDRVHEAEERCRTLLSHQGFHEAFCYAMIGVGEDDPFVQAGAPPPIAVTNPIAESLARLRRSILPGLLRSADLNLRRGTADVRLFEVGRVFLSRSGSPFPAEPSRAAVAWSGASRARHWSERSAEVDFYDAAGVVEAILDAVVPGIATEVQEAGLGALHPGRSACWVSQATGEKLAWGGEIHPDLARQLDVPARIVLAEVDLDRLLTVPSDRVRHEALPRVPSATRDLSFVVRQDVGFRRLIEALETVKSPAPVRFDAIDRYEGGTLAPGEISITVRVILQPLERTLTDVEVEAYRELLVGAAGERLGARLRA